MCRLSQRYIFSLYRLLHGTIFNEAKSLGDNRTAPLSDKKVGPHATMPPRRHLFFITGNGILHHRQRRAWLGRSVTERPLRSRLTEGADQWQNQTWNTGFGRAGSNGDGK
jgi:hypothetical protein